MRTLEITRSVGTLALALCACTTSTSTPSSSSTPPEVLENASARIREADIRARLRGDDLTLLFPLERIEDGVLTGTLRVDMIDITGSEDAAVDFGRAVIAQASIDQTHVLTIPGGAAGLARSDSGGRVIDWRIELPTGTLHGKKSLYAALGRLEVELRGPTEIQAGRSAPMRVIVRDELLRGVDGAAITAHLEHDDTTSPLFTGTTDALGELLTDVSMPAGATSGTVRVEVTHGEAQVWAESTLRSITQQKIYLSSDKTIYKPGQDIQLRALALEAATLEPLAAAEAVFEALDGKGNKVFKKTTTTDAHGVAALAVPTDTRVNEGAWVFRVDIAGARGQIDRPVERYNLPKMKLLVTTDSEFVMPGEQIVGHVDGAYLFGEPVTSANVTVTATTKAGAWIGEATGTTDLEGRFDFSLDVDAAMADLISEDGGEVVTLAATLIDGAGQREEASATMPLTLAPLVIQALPELGQPVVGVENVIYILVSDPAGRPVVADVDIAGFATVTSDASGVAELRMTPSDGAVQLDITATDGAGRSHSRALALDSSNADLLVVRTDRAVYDVGDVANVSIIASPNLQRIFLDVFKGAEGVESRAVGTSGGRGEVQLTITEAMRGTLVLDAFALGSAGTVVRGSRRAFVDPQNGLNIQLTAASESYLPGQTAQIDMRVTDQSGAPVTAALGLNVVNEATFALGGEPGERLPLFFNVDSRALPGNISVAGRSARDLFSQSGSERERTAQLLFAKARDLPSPGFEYNSVREELPVVTNSIRGKVYRDASALITELVPLVEAGVIDQDNVHEQIQARSQRLIDPFGRFYAAKVGVPYTWNIELTSAGPDERLLTADDVTRAVNYQWLMWSSSDPWGWGWDDEVQAGGFPGECAACGGPVDFADADGGVPAAPAANQRSAAGGAAKVRSDFRETVYSNPMLITDGNGAASLSFPLADSIATWRATAEGSTLDGKLGAEVATFRTFQSFFVDFDVPVQLTRGDEIELRAIVYNYLPEPATVTVSLDPASWLTVLTGASEVVNLGPSEVRAVKFRVRVDEAGDHQLILRGDGTDVQDALVRQARVAPDGKAEDQTFSDKINGVRDHVVHLPADALTGGTSVELTLTPGFAAEAVQGTESLLHEPGGCFEQTTSTAWPNTLVTIYLEDTGQLTDELAEEAFGFVTRGYQRLLTFESPTGGFNWWGDNDPGNRILSAIMLWHLNDLARVIEIDEAVRDRTLSWLLAQQNADGSWDGGDALHSGNEVLGTSSLRTTAFIAWALAHTGWADASVADAAEYLGANPAPVDDVYANALQMNALAMAAPSSTAFTDVVSRLDALKETRGTDEVLWPADAPSWTGTSGDTLAIETTGLVAYGMMKAQVQQADATAAMKFIVANKDAVGTWYNTQATMNALRALSAAASPQGSDAEGTLTVKVGGVTVQTETITAADGDVYRKLDLTPHLSTGDNTITLEMVGTGELSYRLNRRIHRATAAGAPAGPLDLTVSWDQTTCNVGDTVTASITAVNNETSGSRDQVMVRVGRAPGMTPRSEDLEQLEAAGKVSRYEVNADDVTFYLMGLDAGEARVLDVRFTPTLAIDGAAPASKIYAYYEPSLRAELDPVLFSVAAP